MACIKHWNIRGLKSPSSSFQKVKKLTTKLEDVQKLSVLNVQETHLLNDNEIPQRLKNFDHLYHIVPSHACQNDKGAGILIFINKTEDIIETEELVPGRLVYVKYQNKNTSEIKNLFSFYGKSHATSNEIKAHISKMNDKISENHLVNVLLCGDFNFVTSLLDRNSSHFTSVDNNYRQEWAKFQLNIGLIDAFRVTSPKKRQYTYLHTNGTSRARLDRIYVSEELVSKIASNTTEHAFESDHKIVDLNLARKVDIGPGNWIFNNSLLADENFVKEIKEVIKSYEDNSNDFTSKRALWEFLKQNLASVSKDFSRKISRAERYKMENIAYKLEILDELKEEELNPSVLNEIEKLKESQNEYTSRKIRGSILRSKIPGIEEGELNLAYYSKLEKLRAEQNTIYSLLDKDGILVEGTQKVSEVVYEFYKNLYTKEVECTETQDEFLSGVSVKISEEERLSLDMEFTEEELKAAMKDLKKDKSPGSDGLTKEFYDFFWESLYPIYMECIKEVDEKEELTDSQKRGLIRISYKKNGRVHIENYRPITLLNVDLKIITRTLAKRMSKVLPKLIHENQRCIPGRKITKNIHIVQDIIDVVNLTGGKAAFILLDQEKAFDRMSHTFMIKTLKAFGFGNNFIKWVKIIYSDISSVVKVNGFQTPEFSIQRGVRQGCPLSALLYVLCAEVLGIEIRNNKKIVGYKYGCSKEQKLCQYADDACVVITTMESLDELFRVLEKYEWATNARLNKGKTVGLWTGEWKGRLDKPLNLEWTSEKANLTGVYVGNDREMCSLSGFSEILEKVKTKLAYWKGKFLSLKGKIKALNIFVLSKVWYCLECQDIPKVLKKEFDSIISSFI